MKSTAILLDTNIILDWLLDREPYSQKATNILEDCCDGILDGYVAAHSITNIFYIARKHIALEELRKIILQLFEIVTVVPINKDNIKQAIIMLDFNDIEDAVQVQCAKDINAKYILTRNIKDFVNSTIEVVDYDDFIY